MKSKSTLSQYELFKHEYWGLCILAEEEKLNLDKKSVIMLFKNKKIIKVPIAIISPVLIENISDIIELKSSMVEFLELVENLTEEK